MKTSALRLVRAGRGTPPGPEGLLARLGQLPEDQRAAVRAALQLAEDHHRGARLASGEPVLDHALGAAALVAELLPEADAISASLLAPIALCEPAFAATIAESRGPRVSELVEGVLRMQAIPALSERPAAPARPVEAAAQLEALRKMLLAMVQDIRVVLIKLADHVQELRFAVAAPEGELRRQAAQLTADIYSPLANRLGVWQLKWQMEDLAFRIIDPDSYQRIARLLDERRPDRERYIETITALLKGELARAGIAADVRGRPKHIYSIHKKLQAKGVDFGELYDVRAVRVLVDDVKDCYAALGVVHNLWSPVPGEFDDYIAKPKSNQYRSLHTAVIGPGDKALEVQIRTHDMDREAELGVAAHWRYKEGARGDEGYDRKIAWLRQIVDWKGEPGHPGGLAERFRTGLFDDVLYVLTPQARVIALPKGATPVDFAYHVHTELGHRCRGARVDGVMVPLNTPLANGQTVEILPGRTGGPSRDWLNPGLGYVGTAAARAKVRQWFNRQQAAEAVANGRAALERELRRHGMTGLGLERLASRLGYARTDDMLADIGRGDLRSGQLEQAIGALDPRAQPVQEAPVEPSASPGPRARTTGRSSVLIVGVDRLLTVPAKCCQPAPPDAIVGFITRGRGVTLHRAGCPSLKRLDRRRRVAAEWGEAAGVTFPVDIEIVAARRAGLAREVRDVFSREGLRVAASRMQEEDSGVRMRYTVAVENLGQLQNVLDRVRALRGVARAGRRQAVRLSE